MYLKHIFICCALLSNLILSNAFLKTIRIPSDKTKLQDVPFDSAFKIIDESIDGITHNPLILDYSKKLKSFFGPKKFPLLSQIIKMTHFGDLAVVTFSVIMHKHILRFIHYVTHMYPKASKYENSFIGFMEVPVSYLTYFFPFLYLIDLGSLLFHYLGFEFHLKVNNENIS